MTHTKLKNGVVLMAVALVTGVASPAATAANAPVRLTFEKTNQFDGTWEGSVRGDIAGHLTTKLETIRVTGAVWHVTFDWIVDAGEKSFTARLNGTVNSAKRTSGDERPRNRRLPPRRARRRARSTRERRG